jgi:hypothetical protein
MDFMNEYGLLVAIATPVLVLALINVLLALGGEAGTLLLPSLRAYPPVLDEAPAVAMTEPQPRAESAARRASRDPVTADAEVLLAREAA